MSAGAKIRVRRDTSAGWSAVNPTLLLGEPGLETDTNRMKYGDGFTAWNNLPYQGFGPDVSNDLIPTQDSAYDLGSADKKWRSLYLSGNTIFLGDTQIGTSDSGGITVTDAGGTSTDLINAMTDRGADTTDWDSITRMGMYNVSRDSWSGVSGAPTDSISTIGTLVVTVATANASVAIGQVFLPASNAVGNAVVQWNRHKWANTWTAWRRVHNEGGVMEGGEF